jgi:hypothetical protein
VGSGADKCCRASIFIVPKVLRSCSRSMKVAVQYWSWQLACRRMLFPVSRALAITAIGSSENDPKPQSGQVTANLSVGSCIVILRRVSLNAQRAQSFAADKATQIRLYLSTVTMYSIVVQRLNWKSRKLKTLAYRTPGMQNWSLRMAWTSI